ncbi:MAG: histidine kinase [Lentimicrobiaceae bacterium]|nr:histidine kinase [Lentimicrobiaceae bacterium]
MTYHPSPKFPSHTPFSLFLSPFSLLLFFLLPLVTFSQQPQQWTHAYVHRHYGVREGLTPSEGITAFQDSYGYLWFATFDGLNRFDGLNFDNYSHQDLKISSRVIYINQYESTVYVVSERATVFLHHDNTIEDYPLPDDYRINGTEILTFEDKMYLFNCVHAVKNNEERNVILIFDLKTKTYIKFANQLPHIQPYISDQKIYGIAPQIANQQLNLYRIDDDTIQMVHTTEMETGDRLFWFKKTKQNDGFGTLIKKSDSKVSYHLYQCFINNDTLRLVYISQWNTSVDYVERFNDNCLILNDDYFARLLDLKERRYSIFPSDILHTAGLLIDKDNNFWFWGNDGVNQIFRFFFESYRLDLDLKKNTMVAGVFEDSKKNIWVSSENGIYKIDKQGNIHQQKIIYNNKNFTVERFVGNEVICEDKQGRIFMTTNSGVAIFDPKKGNENQIELISNSTSLALYFDSRENVLYYGGSTEGAATLNALNAAGEDISYLFGYKHIISICRDCNQRLRLGTWTSEAWLDEDNQKIVNDTTTRLYSGITAMALDEKGILWKGTPSGLFAENSQGNDQQISSQQVYFVLNYKNKFIIWGDKNILNILDIKEFHRDGKIFTRSFNLFDGFDIISFRLNGASIDQGGYVWITTDDKVIRFHPEKIMKIPQLQPHSPYIAAIYNADKNQVWRLVNTNSSIQFENKENYLRFDLLLAEPSAPDKLVFRYKLNGYSDQWLTSTERSFIFQNLPFGKYRLEVQASMDEQQWSETVYSPFITIKRPFLLSFVGLFLIFLGITGIVVFFIYYTRKIIMRKEDEKRQIDQLKHRAIKAKFIPHFTGNVLNSINYLISKNSDLAQKYISDFAGFSNQTLLNSDTLYRTLQEELEYTQLYLNLEKLRFEEKLEYEIVVEPEVDKQISVPTMVLQTFCENALKHGLRPKPEGGKITVRIYKQENHTVLTVEDNGIGRENAQALKTEGTKEGLKIIQQQLDILNKNLPRKAVLKIVDLYDAEGQAAGTRFEVWM